MLYASFVTQIFEKEVLLQIGLKTETRLNLKFPLIFYFWLKYTFFFFEAKYDSNNLKKRIFDRNKNPFDTKNCFSTHIHLFSTQITNILQYKHGKLIYDYLLYDWLDLLVPMYTPRLIHKYVIGNFCTGVIIFIHTFLISADII